MEIIRWQVSRVVGFVVETRETFVEVEDVAVVGLHWTSLGREYLVKILSIRNVDPELVLLEHISPWLLLVTQ